jgi:hypothetical protein
MVFDEKPAIPQRAREVEEAGVAFFNAGIG